MSTRCQIGFYEVEPKSVADLENFQALIYRHSDGYPDGEHGVINTIAPILIDFDGQRGLHDIEYASAWLVAKLKTTVLNIGISRSLHSDIEFFYAVSPKGIKVYSSGCGGFGHMKHLPKQSFTFAEYVDDPS